MTRSTSHWHELHNDPEFLALFEEIMSKDELDYDERRAGELLTAILGAERWVPRDVHGAQGEHELDLVMSDASWIAVEVTSHTANSKAAFARELEHMNPISASSLRSHWQVDVDVPADQKEARPLLDRIKNELEEILRQVEQHDLFEEVKFVPPDSNSTRGHPLRQSLRELRVVCAQARDTNSVGAIWLYAFQGAFWFGPNDIALAAGAHIEPKLDKLLRAKRNGASEAHLFVWLPTGVTRSPGASAAVMSLLDYDRITQELDLRGLDSVWVTSSGRREHAEIHGHRAPVYRYDQNGWHTYTLGWQTRPA